MSLWKQDAQKVGVMRPTVFSCLKESYLPFPLGLHPLVLHQLFLLGPLAAGSHTFSKPAPPTYHSDLKLDVTSSKKPTMITTPSLVPLCVMYFIYSEGPVYLHTSLSIE